MPASGPCQDDCDDDCTAECHEVHNPRVLWLVCDLPDCYVKTHKAPPTDHRYPRH